MNRGCDLDVEGWMDTDYKHSPREFSHILKQVAGSTVGGGGGV